VVERVCVEQHARLIRTVDDRALAARVGRGADRVGQSPTLGADARHQQR